MMDVIYLSHVKHMLMSVAFWKGLNRRDPKWDLSDLNAWLEALEKCELYLAFNVLDVPHQYHDTGYGGGFEADQEALQRSILSTNDDHGLYHCHLMDFCNP